MDFNKELWGKYRAYVRDTNDPERRGRIRVYAPQIMGPEDADTKWLGWAEACLPWVGGGHAIDFAVPLSKADNGGVEVPVWVEFEGGQVDFPIWTGMAVYAPTTKDASLVKAAVSDQTGVPDAGLLGEPIDSLGEGSTLGSLNPPFFAPDQGDMGGIAKADKRYVIGVQGGGMIIIDGPIIDIVGALVRINGRTFVSSLTEIIS